MWPMLGMFVAGMVFGFFAMVVIAAMVAAHDTDEALRRALHDADDEPCHHADLN